MHFKNPLRQTKIYSLYNSINFSIKKVKTTFNKKALEKAIKQIKSAMVLINDWAAGDLTEDCYWRFVPAIYFESEITRYYRFVFPPSLGPK